MSLFYGTKKGGAKCKHFIVFIAIKYTTEAYIRVKIAYYARN